MYNYSMKVSIIIPIYNSESQLNKCIDSVADQTFRDIEIILVNDGSTDGSESICRSYAAADPRIRLISRENAGVSAARNAGLDAVTGELITFIDSDDSVESDYVEYLLELLDMNHSDIACCQYHDIADSQAAPKLLNGPEACLKEYLTSNDILASVCCKLYRKELFDGIRFPAGKRFEDNSVLYRLISRCSSITVGYLKKYNYLDNPASFVNEPFSPSQMDIIDAMLLQRQFIKENYPSLLQHANSLVIYGANRCLTKMADSGISGNEYIDRLKPLYKEYGKDFLKGPSGRSAKNFYRVARISPKLAMRLYRLFRK